MHGPRYVPGMLAWDDLRIFLAVHRTRSHAGAARALRVAPTTVGRRLAALEAAVGARLFTRAPEGLAATAAARALLPRAERVEAEVLEAERELAGADARATGTVRITCGDGWATYVLAPALPAFLAAHPGLTVELVGDVRAVDLTRGEADVALRHFRPRERSLVARRLGDERLGLYAAPAYLARRGTPRTAQDLAAHDLVLFERELDRAPGQAWLREVAAGARVALRTRTTTAMHAACAAGAGVALLMAEVVASDPRYVRVLPRLEPPPNEIWAVTHPDLRAAARVSVALRWLTELARRP
ncbi:LysR family transcriptional regulator [Anaeromyxobacter diazotrophicus]|uniref:LysR family transcriptional regulator n=1 Tax=Anaeromyxobacter diazotrophicus TaxID=2590199 RepID=A0A7I9VH43_9BACT|nr:LysR family transcriptional regulator [Anaeromyxobacter diazotrophicus]GEJ55357.1 LysR family transcriptional regulator [Anaeromyxobacter diazotrophicus]